MSRRRAREARATSELAEALHAWAARWVEGHDDVDRASCGSVLQARQLIRNGGRRLLIRESPKGSD